MAKRKDTSAVDDYDDILNRSWEDIPVEKTLPSGDYLLAARNAAYMAPKEEGKSGKVVFFLTPKEPIAGEVDEDALAELGDDYDLGINEVSYTVWIESMRSWGDVRQVLAKFGIEGGNIRQSLKDVRGRQIVGTVGSRTFTTAAGELKEQNVVTSFKALD